jgi:hypothetical protein
MSEFEKWFKAEFPYSLDRVDKPLIRIAYQAGKPKWISVEDRLPDVGTKVMTFSPCVNNNQEQLRVLTWFSQCSATHWMPLPTPPALQEDSE